MPMENDIHVLTWLLLRVSFQAKKGLMELIEDHDVTIMQALAVCFLEVDKAVPMNSISSMLVCDASNVTGIVDKLVANKLIDRKESDVDRRVHTITLTKKGAAIRAEFLQNITKEYFPNMKDFSQKNKLVLQKFLEKLLI
jgi:DNA-binding MarR family transcriptional regulator